MPKYFETETYFDCQSIIFFSYQVDFPLPVYQILLSPSSCTRLWRLTYFFFKKNTFLAEVGDYFAGSAFDLWQSSFLAFQCNQQAEIKKNTHHCFPSSYLFQKSLTQAPGTLIPIPLISIIVLTRLFMVWSLTLYLMLEKQFQFVICHQTSSPGQWMFQR